MKKDLLKKICIFFLALSICAGIFSQITFPGEAAQKNSVITVSSKTIKEKGTAAAINKAINDAVKKQKKSGGRVTVKVAPGTYNIKKTLILYSNITLDLSKVTLKRTGSRHIIHVGPYDSLSSGASGYCYKNITIKNGILDCGGGSTTGIKAAHLKNFKLSGVTVMNAKNAHLMEIAACNGLTLKNCTFKDQIISKHPYSFEAVQLDVIAKDHFDTYRSEALPVKNVKISGCTFENVPRGIGSHTSILNAPASNISITGNVFKNCKSCAIQACSWKDVTISDNTITGSPRGIALFSVNSFGTAGSSYGTFKASYFQKSGGIKHNISNKYKKPAQDQKIVISGNTIKLSNKKDPYGSYQKTGILISGTKLTRSVRYSDGSGKISKGSYYISGANIHGNKITTGANGIRLRYVRNAVVEQNTVTRLKGSKSSGTYGIHVAYGTRDIKIRKNIIKKGFETGISASNKARVRSIFNNKIYSPKKAGISVSGSYVKNMNRNHIYSSKKYGISITNESEVKRLKKNVCKKCKGKHIKVSKGCKIKKRSGNK